MALIDKAQAAWERITTDQTQLNAAEIVTLQQAVNALELGLVKTEFYIQQATNNDVKEVLTDLRDDFLVGHIQKATQILDKAGIPYMTLNARTRIESMTQAPTVFTNEEVLLDTVFCIQATLTGLQAGAVAAVRGDVRDFFITARDDCFKVWRNIGMTAVKVMPDVIPPRMSGVHA